MPERLRAEVLHSMYSGPSSGPSNWSDDVGRQAAQGIQDGTKANLVPFLPFRNDLHAVDLASDLDLTGGVCGANQEGQQHQHQQRPQESPDPCRSFCPEES